jgi:hypothetical protein
MHFLKTNPNKEYIMPTHEQTETNKPTESSKDNTSNNSSPVAAITFYSKQTHGKPPGFYQGILSEENKKDVLRLKEGLEKAAKERGETPPKVEITLYLVPDSDSSQTHTSREYLEAKAEMIKKAREFYGCDIVIKDFLLDTKVTSDELEFLQGCKSMGSIADIVKTRTIIENKGRPCLQTDSNVTWANNDYDKLYQLTFAQNKDAFNASRCSEVYVSAHNKLVFTSSDSKLPEIFNKTLIEYCHKYKNDSWHKDPRCNGVYDFAFCEGMAQHGLTYRVRVADRNKPGETFDFYPARLDDDRFKLMSTVVPCQRESWRAGMSTLDPVVQELTGQLELPQGGKKPPLEVNINGVDYGYFHFKSLVRVFTNIPSWHAEENNCKHVGQTKDFFVGAERVRNQFIEKQDIKLSMKIFATYYNTVKEKWGNHELDSKDNPLITLSNLIPETEAGDKLCQALFNCSAKELHQDPNRQAKIPQENINFDTKTIPTFHQVISSSNSAGFNSFKERLHELKEGPNEAKDTGYKVETTGMSNT